MAKLAGRVVPTPEITPTRTAVERIAAFTLAARPEDLTPGIRRLYKRNILDSLGCAIAALPAAPFSALREQVAEYRAPGNCTLIAGGKTAPDQAAFFNTALIRYVDMLDSYMASGGLCHPSDNAGTVLTAAEYAQASGEQFKLALAISYEIQCRFTAAVSLMPKDFNHATQLAMSAAAACGKLFGLSAEQLAQAIAIATADNVSLACQVGPPQLDTARVQAPDAQVMVACIEIFPDPKLTARFPKELAARVTVRTKDGRVLVKEHLGYQGGIDNPLTWEQVVEKFHWLSEACADEQLRGRLIDAVDQLDTQPVSHLMGLLAQVRPMPDYARTHRGIQ